MKKRRRQRLRVVVYDIANPKRLREVAKTCEKYLYRVQKSVFEGELTKSQLYALKADLKKIINRYEDSVIVYFIRRSDVKKQITLGKETEDRFVIL